MCGFIGFTNGGIQDPLERKNILKSMTEAIHHRGPDSDGLYSDEDVSLGFRRLSIIDLSDVASQPMTSEDGRIAMVFNGEIYNFESLREDLVNLGHTFKSHSDSEVLLHGYEAYGTGILDKLRGMFAFCIWDKQENRLFLGRDFFGIKPLYYSSNTQTGDFIFGSEIKSFLKYPEFIKKMNKRALKPYLTFQYSVLDETFFEGVYKLKPAHYMVIENGKATTHRYWHNDYKSNGLDLKANVAQIKQVMEESVAYHKISDVQVGSFLSGGVDSSYITALLQPHKTFSVGFDAYEDLFDETNLAEALSKQLGIENHKKIISADACFEALPIIQYHMDEPQSNPSSVPLYFLSQLAAEHVTVVLSGEGADELFAGYVWYQNSKLYDAYTKVPYAVRKGIAQVAAKLPDNRGTNFLVKAGTPIESKFIGQARVFEPSDADQVLKPVYRDAPDLSEITSPIYQEVKDKDDLTKMQYLDLNLWLPGDILLKADKMSMAHSLELRVPFLDKEVIRAASMLPANQRIGGGESKRALRIAAKEVLPDAWARRPKVGFPVPIRHWFREKTYYDLVKKAFTSEHAKEFFNTDVLVNYLDKHFSGTENHARHIWTIYVFLVWYDVFFCGGIDKIENGSKVNEK